MKLYESCFKLHTGFNKVKLVQLERLLFLLGLWPHQRKTSFLISVMSHKAEVKPQSLSVR